MEYTHVKHTFLPVYNEESRILILGSFPSVKSRENQFYYGHPQNRFWKVIAGIFKEPLPQTIDEKKDLLLRHRIAVWDVIDSCDIVGSSDGYYINSTTLFKNNTRYIIIVVNPDFLNSGSPQRSFFFTG